MTTPTILVVGATGNTGQSTVRTLSNSLKDSKKFSGHRILALTRSSTSAVAQQLAKLPGVEVLGKPWLEISPEWLREQGVVRAFIASHNEPTQFAEESTFHLAALNAGVEYVVRISTTKANVHPNHTAYYPRQHWAIETMLATPEFERLQWTSLQPAGFTTMYLHPAVEFIKKARQTGNNKQETLRLMASEDGPAGVIHLDDVGTFAAHLLLVDDVSKHNKGRYEMSGPEDITGRQIVELVEKEIGAKVENVSFKDMTFLDQFAESVSMAKPLALSLKSAPETTWEGKSVASGTSKEVLDICPPRITCKETLERMLKE